MQTPRNYGATALSTSNNVSGAAPTMQTAALNRTNASDLAHDEPWRAKVLVTGMRRSGKSSVQQVVFKNVPPKDTFYIETTTRLTKMNIDSMVALQFWDCPGSMSIEHLGVPLTYFSSIIFVIDIQDDYNYPIAHLVNLIAAAADQHPSVNLEVFVHKAEALSDEFKIENFRQIQSRIINELLDHPAGHPLTNMQLNFYLTSVYDHTIYEAFSRVVQKLIPQLPTSENLLNTLVANSGIAKAFLFDITSLIYVATDASPVDTASFELCCDYVQTLTNFSNLYRNLRPGMITDSSAALVHSPSSSAPSTSSKISQPTNVTDSQQLVPPKSSSSSPSHSLISTTKSQASSNGSNGAQKKSTTKSVGSGSASLDRLLPVDQDTRRWASSSAKLTPESTLAYWEITDTLALVVLIRSQTFEEHKGLIEYNVTFFRGAIQKIIQLDLEKRNR
ncbi:hypothetical protein FRC03_005652 [Tulasnella sp. 419]|nr:hypothetical protein FRC02_009338 [Tulasnella sp. 418]KAG8961222.1 hypothetical protein FRC03_005652 [Tulasnella sp. 419]